jgi:ribosomal protein S18 acetylase RimI-like enzyme
VIEDYQEEFHNKKLKKHTNDLRCKTAAVAALAYEIWREHFTPIIGAAQTDYMLNKFQSAEQIFVDINENGYIYFTVESIENNEMIGYCACRPIADYMLLSKLYVQKDYRGRGVARSLLNEVVALCRFENAFEKIRLAVNKHNDDAIASYHKIGFETIDSVKTDIGEGFIMDDYIMEFRI